VIPTNGESLLNQLLKHSLAHSYLPLCSLLLFPLPGCLLFTLYWLKPNFRHLSLEMSSP